MQIRTLEVCCPSAFTANVKLSWTDAKTWEIVCLQVYVRGVTTAENIKHQTTCTVYTTETDVRFG